VAVEEQRILWALVGLGVRAALLVAALELRARLSCLIR